MSEHMTEPHAPVVDDKAAMFEGVAPGILRARQAFLRDLPELLAIPTYDRWTAAYHGDERIAFAASQREVIRECVKRGLADGDCFVGMIVPFDDDAELDSPRDE